MKLRLATVEWSPVSLLEKHDNGTVTLNECPTKSFLDVLAEKLNLSYELIMASDDQYGTPQENGSWNGMVGMLQRNECDITITPLTITYERLSVMKFSKELFPDPYTISSQSGKNLESDLIDFLKSVNFKVWLLLLVSVFIIISVNSLSQKLMKTKVTYLKEFWQFFQILLFQTDLKFNSLTLYSGLVSLFVLCYYVITNWLTALIGSLIVFGLQKTLIETVSQLAEAKDVVPTLYFGTGIETYFKRSELKENKEIWRRIQAMEKLALLKNDESYDNPKLIELLTAGKAAMIESHNDAICLKIYYCKLYPDLRMHISKETFYDAMQALGYRIDFDLNLITKIDKLIHAIQAHGFLKKWFDKMFIDYANTNSTKTHSCIDDQSDLIDNINYIDLKKMRTCYYLLGCGIGFALLIFVCEFIEKFCYHKSVGEYHNRISHETHCSYNNYNITIKCESLPRRGFNNSWLF